MTTRTAASCFIRATSAVGPALAEGQSPGAAQIFFSPAGEPIRSAHDAPHPPLQLLEAVDLNHDGKTSRDERVVEGLSLLDALDTDKDGVIATAEHRVYEASVSPDLSLDPVAGCALRGGGGPPIGAAMFSFMNIRQPIRAGATVLSLAPRMCAGRVSLSQGKSMIGVKDIAKTMRIRRTGDVMAAAALATAFAMIAEPGAAALDTPLSPGQWEVKRERSGGPGGGATTASIACFTPAQLAADPGAVFKTTAPVPENGGASPSCALSGLAMADGKVSYIAACVTPVGQMRAPAHGIYTATSFAVSSEMSMGLMKIRMTMNGRYLGACNGT